MSSSDAEMFEETLRAFRKRRIEPAWDRLNAPDDAQYLALWRDLHALGATAFALPEDRGGVTLDARCRFTILRALGAASPALAFGLVSHVTALALLGEASGELPAPFDAADAEARVALAASPLDALPETGFELVTNGSLSLSGTQRVALAYPGWIVVPARDGERLRLCVVSASDRAVRFAGAASSHGLGLVPVGDLTIDRLALRPEHVLGWPSSGRAANEADGLVTAILTGMADELVERAAIYALDRYQGGKMIHEHDAVQQLTGPIDLARRALEALALATLDREKPGDGGASAFAVDLVRRSGLDAVQTFGGYGYMEDFRVERYLRDANTLETCWIHAEARQRAVARARFAEMTR